MTIVLRPFRVDEVDALWARRQREIANGSLWGPSTREQVAERVANSGTWTDTAAGLLFAIEADGVLVGDIQARRSQGIFPAGVVEIGIGLYEAADRGRGIGREAVAQLTARLFEARESHRVQLSTDVDNAGMRRVAELLGFGFEGILRGFMPSAEGLRDYAMYGMTEIDFEDVRSTWTSTS
ncbi:MAG: GNAT family N-acetyltransferase [Actinomycetota bacterium]